MSWSESRLPLPAPAWLCGGLAVAVLGLVLAGTEVPDSGAAGVGAVSESLLRWYSWWPRLAMSLVCGAALALAGVLMQQVLRNPLASPTTLGVASGANLALMTATLMAPGLLAAGREWVALAGGTLAMLLVFSLAWRQALSPLVVVLAGLVVNLYLGAAGMVLLLFQQETLKGLLIWGAGSLAQNGWDDLVFLLPRVAFAVAGASMLMRPLAVLELDDGSASGLGVSLRQLRAAALGLAVFLTACVVSVVGVIGFIGLAAPNIARLAGARSLSARLLWSSLLGALLLSLTDLLLQHYSGALPTFIPTGATTAALGAPLLLWLVTRLRLSPGRATPALRISAQRRAAPYRLMFVLLAVLSVLVVVALCLGRGPEGWQWHMQWAFWQWRLPRVLAALAAGVLLSLAGTILQRLSGNPMASPEILGISGGSAMALMAAVFLLPGVGNMTLAAAGAAGAVAVLALMVILNRGNGFAPERLLLTGVAITALFDAVRAIVLAGGDPRGQQIIAWLSGSTYYVDLATSVVVAVIAAMGVLLTPLFARWLDILPLGQAPAVALGVRVAPARVLLLALVALLTACATMLVGPLSFVGLLAPHMARLAGLVRARAHLIGAALIGATLMLGADWAGRQLLFPDEIPAGLMASLIGGAYFMWSLRRA